MTRRSSDLPALPPSSEFEFAENALLTLWRTFWLDLSLAWGSEVDRLLYPWIQPADTGDRLLGLNVGNADRIGEVKTVRVSDCRNWVGTRLSHAIDPDRQASPRWCPA